MVAVETGTVLLVEDDEGVATLQRKRLERAGFDVVSVDNAEEAMRVVQRGGVDLMVLDYRLPGNATGLEFYGRLKVMGYDLPVIMVTGFSEEATVVKALRAGVRDFVSKSVEYLDYLPEAAKRVLLQVRMERKLIESEARLASIIDTAKDAIILVEDQRITLFNAAAELMFRCPAEQAMGKPITHFIPNEYDVPPGTSAGEGPVSFIVRTGRQGKRADGTEFPLEASTSRAEVGGRRFHTVMVRDTTERERAQRQIQEQAALLDEANDAITVSDLDGRISYWSHGAERLYGWTKDEAARRTALELLHRQPAEQLHIAKQASLEKGEWAGELRQLTKAGKDIVVASRWTLVRTSTGEPKALLVINTDITEKKKAEGQYLRAQRMESLGTLAGGIAHDLNNVLTPVLMAMELLQREHVSPTAQSILATARASAERGADLVRQILTFARGAEGRRQPLLLSPLIGEISKLLQQTFPKAIAITTDVPKDLWLISADATHIHQVLMNLSVNARDAMPGGGRLTMRGKNVVLGLQEAKAAPELAPGRYVLLTVQDTGTGIAPEVIDKIFDPFFTTKELGRGTGLGLSTSMGIVKSHGGVISVYSEVGKGTRFNIYLPALETAEVRQDNEARPRLPSGKGELILVVDDEKSILQLSKVILETNGYRVITAGEGLEAVELFKQRQAEIDIVITDMAMPHMDGPAIIRALRAINPSIRIIANSGLLPEFSRNPSGPHNVEVAGAEKFLVKPYTAFSLLTTLQDVLRAEEQKNV